MALSESRPKLVDAVECGSIVTVGRAPHPTASGFRGDIGSLELSGLGKEAGC